MHNESRTPFVYPFANKLIDESGNLCDIDIESSNIEYITSGIIATTPPGEVGPDRVILIANSKRSIEIASKIKNPLPQYVGRGMIRLHLAEKAKDDRYINLELNELQSPDRTFGEYDFAAYIWDDEQLGLIDAPEDEQPEINRFRRFRLTSRDSGLSQNTIALNPGTLRMDQPSPWVIPCHLGLRRCLCTPEGNPLEQFRKHRYLGHTQTHCALINKDDELVVLDRQLNETAHIPNARNAIITASNRFVTFEKSEYPAREHAHVFTCTGEHIKEVPDFRITEYHFNTMSLTNAWFPTGSPRTSLNLYNAELELCGTTPEENNRYTRISPDGKIFCTKPASLRSPAMFRMYAADGEIQNAFTYRPIEFIIRNANLHKQTQDANKQRRYLQNTPEFYTFRETIYAANIPTTRTRELHYETFAISRTPEPGHGWYIVAPYVNSEQCCPVCAWSWQGENAVTHTRLYSHAICPHCRAFESGLTDHCYDDSLDAFFGGQFGTARKRWLDRTGWKQEDLDRIERIFQIDTTNWPKPPRPVDEQ